VEVGARCEGKTWKVFTGVLWDDKRLVDGIRHTKEKNNEKKKAKKGRIYGDLQTPKGRVWGRWSMR